MGTLKTVEYHCDKCGKTLKTCNNELDIVTSLSESSYWRRLHVGVVYKHGMHNNVTKEQAALCKTCAIELLNDALKRVHAGERATQGTESSEERGWE